MAVGDLTDVDSVKAWLGIASTTASDALLGTLVTAASAFIVGYVGRAILSASYVERYDGNGAEAMLLRQAPITAVASVAFRGVTLTQAADPVALTNGFLFDDRRLSLVGYRFPWRAPVTVAYTAGYASAPADIAQAATELAGEAFRRKERIGEVSKSLGGQQTVAYSQADMSAMVRSVLDQYRLVTPV